jgi:hypothetical protein
VCHSLQYLRGGELGESLFSQLLAADGCDVKA